jgi:seryl-tRNA synthetase
LKLDKKDISYIMGILIVLLIGSLTVDLSGFKNFPKYLSFGTNLTSIVLSILAIIYAFNQSQESTRQNERVQDGLSSINEKITNLVKIQDDLMSVRENINSQVVELSSSIQDFKEISSSVKDIASQLQVGDESDSEINKQLQEVLQKIEKIEDKNSIKLSTGSPKYKNLITYDLAGEPVFKKVEYDSKGMVDVSQFLKSSSSLIDSLKSSKENKESDEDKHP